MIVMMVWVDMVLFCCGDSFEEELRWQPRLGVSADLVELDDVANGSVTLLKTVEALRGTFFFSTRVELKTKGAGRGGAGHEIIDSNTSLPSILIPKHFFWQFLRSALKIGFCLNFFFRQAFGTQLWLSDLNDHICGQGYNLFGSEMECVVGRWWGSLF